VYPRTIAVALLVTALAGASPRAFAQFETRASFSIGPADPFSVIVGDFNGDGILDVAVLNDVPAGSVEILLGNGDGTFRAGSTYSTAAAFYGAAASLRNNGILDLVFGGAGTDNVYVMLGNGDGTFEPAVAYATTANSWMIALGDFTGNGNIGVADVEGTSSGGVVCDCVEVFSGNGDGTLGAPAATTAVPYNVDGYSIVAGDFNDDGNLDVAVGGGFGAANQVDILLGNGNGTFRPDGYYSLGAIPGSIATGYFTSNKKRLDLAMTNSGLDVMLGGGNGKFQPAVYYTASLTSWVVAEDFNGDGKTDLAASDDGELHYSSPGVTVLNGNGDGTFQAGIFYPVGTTEGGQFVATGDFNGDHKPDLLVLNSVNGYLTTLLNTGVVSFSPTTPLNFGKQSIGTTSAPQTVTLTNTGTIALKISSMKASSEFAVTSTCGSGVAAGQKCTFSATFSPTKQGAAQGTISIIDSASTKPQVIELLGTGT
jgi:hypothetical protein